MATATAAELALLRRLVGDTDPEAQRYTDDELRAALETAPSCPVQLERGLPLPGVRVPLDTYGVAAALWDERALLELTSGEAAAEEVRVSSERNGDLAVSYAGPGKLTGPAVLTPDRMQAMARALRRRSCNAGAQTIVVRTQHGRLEQPWRGSDLYPSQIANLP